ncbi:MAG TPA: flagellar biosynthetic protein FliR [Cerasibacillus sp.]|uniref:flagellar biosynthetic protein FliR n=1 Tax=Cerasibacillus sp. TaxID=2498711 RepID=UPI002F3E6C28
MLELLNLSLFPVFLLVLVRILAFFIVTPLFSYRTVPTLFKIGMSFFLALVFTATLPLTSLVFEEPYIIIFLKEIVVGLMLGWLSYMVVSAVQIAGGFIDFQMGFAIANVVDPQTGAQSPIIGQYFYMISLLFLLSVDGHHLLIDGIYGSFQVVPIDKLITFNQESIVTFIIQTFSQMFIIAFQIAIPIVGCLFLVDLALGIIARTVPQLNVFVVGLPLKIFVSFIVLFLFMALYISLSKKLFQTMFETLHGLMQLIGGA